MNLHADFSQRVLLHGAQMPWIDSPMPGVQRRMLDRIGGEVARATSIVRYASGSHFSAHTHGGGEEFIVLEGVFQDEHGDYPAGTYIRNPPTTRHTPGSAAGCVIFVKLWQFDPADRQPVVIDLDAVAGTGDSLRPGVTGATVFEDARETVRVETWQPGTKVDLPVPGGIELLVLDGSLVESGDTLSTQSWLRLPQGATLGAVAGPRGARVWIKSGHLRFVSAPPAT
jgi:quercetin dioxygenase-like cupin family protein